MSSRKTVPGKSVPGKSIPGKSLPGKSMPGKTVSGKGALSGFNDISSSSTLDLSAPKIRTSNNNLSDPTLPSRYQGFEPCVHLKKVLISSARDTVIKNYSLGVKVSFIASPTVSNSTSIYRSKKDGKIVDYNALLGHRARTIKCYDCSNNCATNFMCLQCPNIGCLKSNHAFLHTKKSNHTFGTDSYLGLLFCFKCGNYVSDPILESVRVKHIKDINRENNLTIPIYPEYEETELMKKYSVQPSYQATTGLRGFVNMGSTCFMSSILQTLIHNPFIRDYFLSGSHFNCPKLKNECITCCIDEIFIEFYTKSYTNGYGPVNLLTAAWNTKRSLAGYSEQDAHEFWQFLVDELHKYYVEMSEKNKTEQERMIESSKSPHSALSSCGCITHKTFAGELQSSITCLNCNSITTTIDPMIDLSLEIQNKHQNNKNVNLYECLDRFTKLEDLDVMYNCSNCNTKTKAVKQLAIKQLPPVLAIQLKRFEHNSTSSKIESHVNFPLFLNMQNYIINNDANASISGSTKSEITYELFAIVCHIGSVNTGHYICMIKNRNGQWFKFDDSVVSYITQEEVINTKAYLLFYIIHQI